MNSKTTLLLYSLPVMLLTSTNSIANNGYLVNDEIGRIIAKAELAAAQAELAAAEAEGEITYQEYSSPWVYIGTAVTGVDYYLNPSSVKEESARHEYLMYKYKNIGSTNSYKRAWWKVVYTNGDFSTIQTKFYCGLDFAIDVASANYDVNNNYKGPSYKNNELAPVVPETVFSKVSNTVCNVH